MSRNERHIVSPLLFKKKVAPPAALIVCLLATAAPAQLVQIMPASLLPDQRTLDFTAGTPGPISPTAPLFTAFGVTSAQLIGSWSPAGDVLSQCVMGNALGSAGGSQLAIIASGAPLDNPTPMVGFGFMLATSVTQAGFIPVDECCFALLVEVYSSSMLVGSTTVPNVGNCVSLAFQSSVPFDEVRFISTSAFGGWGLDNLVLAGFVGPSCNVTAPIAGATVSGITPIDIAVDHALSMPVDVDFEYSTDAGATFLPATAGGATPNPSLGVATPTSLIFDWNSIADGVGTGSAPQATIFRAVTSDASASVNCSVAVTVDNVPSCTIVLAGSSPVRDNAAFDIVPDSSTAATVDATFEFSLDGGATFMLATAAPPSTNPLLAITVGSPSTFIWDSRGDGVGVASIATAVLMRATIDDGTGMATCSTSPFDVDNTSLCGVGCGDCNRNSTLGEITDALTAAQIAVGLFTPTPAQSACCDVDANLSVAIVDALIIAQFSAGLSVTLSCP